MKPLGRFPHPNSYGMRANYQAPNWTKAPFASETEDQLLLKSRRKDCQAKSARFGRFFRAKSIFPGLRPLRRQAAAFTSQYVPRM
jgi:hypothetical protein